MGARLMEGTGRGTKFVPPLAWVGRSTERSFQGAKNNLRSVGGVGGGCLGGEFSKCTFHQKRAKVLLGTPIAAALREGVPFDLGTN